MLVPQAALGAPVAVANADDPALTAQATEPRYFAETGHYVSGCFREFWESRGGLFVFGLPLTSQFTHRSTDGKTYQMQYFERAVFEYHPNNPVPHRVLLRRLAADRLAQWGW